MHSLTALFLLSIVAIDWQFWPEPPRVDGLTACLNAAPLEESITPSLVAPDEVEANSLVTLQADATLVPHSEEALAFSWTQVANGAPLVQLTGASSAVATFLPSEPATYAFQLEIEWFCRSVSLQAEVAVIPDKTPIAQLDVQLVANFPSQLPVDITSPPNDSRLFVVLKSGEIRIISQGTLLTTPFLDISSRVSTGSEQGLLGLAFPANYATDGWFYLDYTGSFPGASGNSATSRLVAYQRDGGNPNLANANTAALLLSITQPESNHNGGQVAFGPDGMLYFGLGDGGGGGDNHGTIGNGQDLNTLLGKLLRLQVNATSMSIPSDNPFVGQSNTRSEIWAYGLRNPWRFSFDRLTGDLYIADVGQNAWEEVNFQPAGQGAGWNYGWRLREGAHCFNPSSGCPTEGLVDPVHEYSHDGGSASITGGYVYRGSAIAPLAGYYLFGDYLFRKIWAMIHTGKGWQVVELQILLDGSPIQPRVITFGQDSSGELYFGDTSGNVYKIVNAH